MHPKKLVYRSGVYGILAAVWIPVSLLSVNYAFQLVTVTFVSATILGLIMLGAIVVTLAILSSHYSLHAFMIFLLFFLFGLYCGPFLEVPADSFIHLQRSNEFCDRNIDELPRQDRGLWHYSMSSVFLCSDLGPEQTDLTVLRIDALHGLYLGLLVTGLFVLAKSAGLPSRWAFLSCCIAVLFFGTNRFAYFSYYSFGPSFSSMLMCWLWVAVFFFRTSTKSLMAGILSALLLVPIIWVNHQQEVFFLVFTATVWGCVNINGYLWKFLTVFHRNLRWVYLVSLFFLLFVLPQWRVFQEFIAVFFVRNFWNRNQSVVYTWEGWHVLGKVWEGRISDTFTPIGFLVVVLAVLVFYPRLIRRRHEQKIRIFLLSITPFLLYCIPLFHFVWISNVYLRDYYRMSYASMFWLFFAFLFWGFEGRVILGVKTLEKKMVGWVR